jgi:hypothetical protein
LREAERMQVLEAPPSGKGVIPVEKTILLEKVAAAKRDIADAESNLEKVLLEIQRARRADKTTISKVVEDAFTKLRAVRTNLVDLEVLVGSDKS